MATRRKFKPNLGDAQQPPDTQNARAGAGEHQNAPLVSPIVSSWPDIAGDLLPHYEWVFTDALREAVRTGVHSIDQVEQIARRHCLDRPLPPDFVEEISKSIIRFFHLVTKRPATIEAALRNFAVGKHASVVYEVFHHGQWHIYPNEVPADIVALRDKLPFWIDHTCAEYRSQGRPRKPLSPRSEHLLVFVSRDYNAGRTVTIPDLYQTAWLKSPSTMDKMRSSVREAISGLNLFARPDIFAHKTDPQAKLVPIKNAYHIRANIKNECCIISVIRSTNERS